jgi:hypothetical protein
LDVVVIFCSLYNDHLNGTALYLSRALLNELGEERAVCYCGLTINHLDKLLENIDIGEHGVAILFDRHNGLVLANSSQSSTIAQRINLFTSNDSTLKVIANTLHRYKLFQRFSSESSFVTQINETSESIPIKLYNKSYHLNTLDIHVDGLYWTLLVITRDDDYLFPVQQANLFTSIWSSIVLLIVVVIGGIFTHCTTSSLIELSTFVRQAGDTLTIEETEKKLILFHQLLEHWNRQMHEHLDGDEIKGYEQLEAEEKAKTKVEEVKNQPMKPDSNIVSAIHWIVNKLSEHLNLLFFNRTQYSLFEEINILQQSIGNMFESLNHSYKQVQQANEAKQNFIRYIFHEVRVPLNALMLGISHIQSSQHLDPDMMNIVEILQEQTAVVTRILNDVLTLQGKSSYSSLHISNYIVLYVHFLNHVICLYRY